MKPDGSVRHVINTKIEEIKKANKEYKEALERGDTAVKLKFKISTNQKSESSLV